MKKIPKIIHQVWVGPLPMPEKWMDTWKEHNPDWKYILWDNKKVFGRKWKNQWMIDEYVRRYEEEIKGKEDGKDVFISALGAKFIGDKATGFAWHVIADIIRYEILHEYGGYMPGADSECICPINEVMGDDFEIYVVNTGHLYTEQRTEIQKRFPGGIPEGIDKIRYNRYNYLCTAPVYACTKGNKFVGKLVEELSKLKIEDLGEAVDTTGNVFMAKMIEKYGLENEKIDFYNKDREFAVESSFSKHHSGTTYGCYKKGQYRDLDLVILTDGKSPAIKYAIRSAVENLEFRKLVIAGNIKGIKPDIYIKRKDLKDPIKSVANKLLAVANDKRVSKEFILMDDDIFIMEPYEEHHYHKGLLRKNIRARIKKRIPPNDYWIAANNTLAVLGKKAIDYSVHAPFEMKKNNVLQLEKAHKISSGKYLIRTLYGNIYNVGGIKTEGFKTRNFLRETKILSTIDKTEQLKEFKEFMGKRFKKSKYE